MMKIALIYNAGNADHKSVINVFGRQNLEHYRADEIERVVQALRRDRKQVETFVGDKYLIEKLETFMPRVLKGEKPGMVFNLAYGIQGESRYTHVPSLLEMLGVPYLGSGPLAHSIALDKAMTKMVLDRAGLPTPRFQVFQETTKTELDPSMSFPLIVKPRDEAVSFGIQVVHDQAALKAAVASVLREFHQPALVEEFLTGRELNIGLLGNGDDMEILPIVEIDFGDVPEGFQTYESKKKHLYKHICPAQIPEELAEEVRRIALSAFKLIQCRDCARIDLRLDAEGRPFILEINSMAAIHPHGSFFVAAQHVGYDYDAFINRMVDVAVTRYFGRQEQKPAGQRRSSSGENNIQARVTEYLRDASSKMEQRLAELVDCNSFARNKEGTDRVGWMMRKSLDQCGFVCQVFPQTEIGDVLLLQNQSSKERADVLLLCHLDVFALPQDETHRRFSREGNRLYGAGIAESKGGLVVIEHAIRALKHLRVLNHLKVKVLLTTDSSLENCYSAPIIRRESSTARYLLSFKLAGREGEVVIRRNGVGLFKALFESKGSAFTDAVDFRVAGAIDEMVQTARAWNRLSQPEKDILVQVISLRAEARSGNVAENAQAYLMLSFPEEEQGEKLAAEIGRIARRQYTRGSDCSLSGGIVQPPFHETEEVLGLYQELNRVADSIGLPLGKIRRLSASDINQVSPGCAAIDGMGPVGHATRTEQEHIEAHTLVERAVLLALFLRAQYSPQ